jgi:hypothetical protein
MVLSAVDIFDANRVTEVTMARAISAAIRPYSIAVTPASDFVARSPVIIRDIWRLRRRPPNSRP